MSRYSRRHRVGFTAVVLLVASMVAACAGPAPAQPTAAPPSPTKAPESPTATVATEPTKAPEAPTATVAAEPTKAAEPAAAGKGEMRKLKGKLTVAVQGALPVEGAPETANQKAWKEVLEKYKQHQPDVEVVIEDLPAGQTGEQWCEARKLAKQMPDVSYVGECNYFRPTSQEIERGLNIATDFKPYETEVNPYSGKPWKDDWFDDISRLGRCTESGAVNMWTCQTTAFSGAGLWVNWDILKEFGYDGTFPKTYTELWDLAKKINDSGKYVAFDNPNYPAFWFAWIMYTNLTMDRWVKAGGDLSKVQATNSAALGDPNSTAQWCKKNYTISENADIQEALKQWKRLVDAFPGGGAAYWDPARDQNGTQWLIGKAAMSYNGTWFYGAIQQAQTDATLAVKNWGIQRFPKLTKDDLFNKDLTISFDGEPFLWAGGGGDVFAPTPNVRASGDDKNVDLLVRDWFQFMSAEGIGIIDLGTGQIPLNPTILDKANPALKDWLTIKPDIFAGITQPPGSYSNEIIYTDDTEKNIQAWAADQVDFETAMKKADENATRSKVKKYEDAMKQAGWPDLPAECAPFRTK